MKLWGQIENAQLENKSSDYTAGPVGRIWWNTTSGQAKLDDGTNIRALLRNDQKAIIGNSGTASQNIRFHRGAANLLQLVQGSDSTAEGSLATTLQQLGHKLETFTTAGRPSAGNIGRIIWDSDLSIFLIDNGTIWIGIRLESFTNAGKPAFGNAGRIIWITDLSEVQVDTGSAWITLAASAGTSARVTALYNYVVGSAGQVASGAATHSTIAGAISAASNDNNILILAGTYAENITINKRLNIEGQGYGSYVNGTVTFASGATSALLKNVRISGNTTINSGVSIVQLLDFWLGSASSVTDNGTGTFVQGVQE